MKKNFILIILAACVFSACNKHILDKKPLDILSSDVVFRDSLLTESYLTNVYNLMGITVMLNETPDLWEAGTGANWDWNGPYIVNEVSNESTPNFLGGQSDFRRIGITIAGGLLEWWESSYSNIRKLNTFIETLKSTSYSDAFKKQRTAEARFLRAYNYFSMVKRYGGVPIITKAQTVNDPESELYPARNKESEVYDFIMKEMDEVYNDLPAKAGSVPGRPSKGAAIALKTRAALYAGSIAQNGTVQLGGIVGIENSLANAYYQKAYDAAKQIMNSGEYALYNQDADKVLNYKNVFVKKDNIEKIFYIQHDYIQVQAGGNGWTWDFFQSPYQPWGAGSGNQNAVYLEVAEEFEKIDGTSGKLDRSLFPTKLWTIDEIWGNRDPRFYATIYTQETPWKWLDAPVDYHNGLILPNGTIQLDGSYNGILGKADRRLGTGFGVMKLLEESKNPYQERQTSGTDWTLFRYSEVLLNAAEAAFELGKTSESLGFINQIRNRAGVAPLSSIDRNKIRHERFVELAFEGHRYWDVRRWRIATTELTKSLSGLRYILDYNTRKYKLELMPNYDGAAPPIFFPHNYYFPITLGRTANNKNLVENPGYN